MTRRRRHEVAGVVSTLAGACLLALLWAVVVFAWVAASDMARPRVHGDVGASGGVVVGAVGTAAGRRRRHVGPVSGLGAFSPVEVYRARVLRHAYRGGKATCPACGPAAKCGCSVEAVASFQRRQVELPGLGPAKPGGMPAAPGAQGRLL